MMFFDNICDIDNSLSMVNMMLPTLVVLEQSTLSVPIASDSKDSDADSTESNETNESNDDRDAKDNSDDEYGLAAAFMADKAKAVALKSKSPVKRRITTTKTKGKSVLKPDGYIVDEHGTTYYIKG